MTSSEAGGENVPDSQASALRKITRRLIPFLFVLYVIAWLDRVNIGFAALQMNRDLKISEAAAGFGFGVFFLGYCLFEVPSNLVLARLGARIWISRIMITWGLISTGMMFVRTPTEYCILRFLLGAAEAGFFPGVVYYLTLWYPAAHRARAVAAFMTAVPVTGLIGGPLSGWLLGLNGVRGLAGWQWLFLCEGLPAVLLGVIVLFYLTDRPELASWLTQSERNYIVDELARERRIHGDTHFAKCESKQFASIWNALTNPIILKLGIIFFLAAIGFLGYSLWAPLVIQSLTGASDLGVGMILGGISAATIVFMLLNGRHSDRADERWIHTAVPLLIMGVGFLGCALLKMPLLAIIFLALVPIGHCSAYGPFWSIPSKFLSGPAAAAGTAMVVTIANVGGFLGPTMIGWLKKHTGTHSAAFLILGAFGVLAAAVAFAGRSQTANGHE